MTLEPVRVMGAGMAVIMGVEEVHLLYCTFSLVPLLIIKQVYGKISRDHK